MTGSATTTAVEAVASVAAAEEGAEGVPAEPPTAQLDEHAVELADVEAAIEELLARYDEREQAADEDDEEISSSYDPEEEGP